MAAKVKIRSRSGTSTNDMQDAAWHMHTVESGLATLISASPAVKHQPATSNQPKSPSLLAQFPTKTLLSSMGVSIIDAQRDSEFPHLPTRLFSLTMTR
ncbi:unnamed protein product [Aureobasidium pullulans]|nr:unnamed protein product [Aureobasidium pullulans]